MDIAEPQRLDRENPWPGLMPFDEAAQEFFHGRDDAVAELARRVRREPLTVLFGQSGLGKTSLLSAGLFPLLRAGDFLPIYLRLDYADTEVAPAEQIKAALAANLVANGVDGRAPDLDETLWGFFHDRKTEFWSRRNRLVTPVLVFDQFEEIFTLGRASPIAAAMVTELAGLIENRPSEAVREALERDPEAAARYDFAKEPCKIVLALREDFLPEFEGLRGQIPSIMNNRMRLTRMDGLQARDAILRSGGHIVDEAVAERIIAFVAASRERGSSGEGAASDLTHLEIEPALLSIVCRELNNKRQRLGQEKITADLLAGAQNEIVADFYKSSLADLDPAVKLFIEERLLTEGGYRDSEALADALAVPGVTREAIDLLVGRRLLRIEDRSGTQWVELTHDRLTEVIREERDARREAQEAEAQRDRAERAEAAAATQATLAREAAERESAAHRLVRRTRIALVATAAMLVVAIAALIFAGYETRQAEEQRQLAIQRADEATKAQQLADKRADEATKAQQLADQRAEEAKQSYKLALDAAIRDIDLVSDHYSSGEITTDLAKSILDSARTTFGGLPEAREDVATITARVRLFYILADTYRSFGDLPTSLDAARTALSLAERLPETDDLRDSQTGYTRTRIGDVLRDQGDPAGALIEYRDELGIFQHLADKDSGNVAWQRELSVVHQRIGDVLEAQEDLVGALTEFHTMLIIDQKLSDGDPTNAEWQSFISIDHEKIGNVLRGQGDLTGALSEYRTKLQIDESLTVRDSSNTDWQRNLSISHEKIGGVLRDQGDQAGALAEFRAELVIMEPLAQRDRSNADLQRFISVVHENIGDVLSAQGDLAGALAEFNLELKIILPLAARDPSNANWQRVIFYPTMRIGEIKLQQNDLSAALDAYTKAEAIAKHLKEINPTATNSTKDLDWVEGQLADIRRRIAAAKK
jgi:tetratricopeptide (TPR) repeat protein